jgi:asparagine synthase (glutamine-hydrolysing)
MSAIAGIATRGKTAEVHRMLEKMAYRGRAGIEVIEADHASLGVAWTPIQETAREDLRQFHSARDSTGDGRLAMAQPISGGFYFKRDPLGVAPLYYGRTPEGLLCFASEVKALIGIASVIQEMPPGSESNGVEAIFYFDVETNMPIAQSPGEIADELYFHLNKAVEHTLAAGEAGVWLSGGLDSSVIAALARQHVPRLHTFTTGLPGAIDLEYAEDIARHVGAEHHELVVTPEELLAALPEVIFHLESFDAQVVRPSLMHYFVARLASDSVPILLSGEGSDEIFAGYPYLKTIEPSRLADELEDITGRLHNTTLQRVDRCTAAHGLIGLVPFLDPEVVEYAFQIPAIYKLRGGVEKWILRQAVSDLLPGRALQRTKSKFWEGFGIIEILERTAKEKISDQEFLQERRLPNRWRINTKEELMYYRIFKEIFGSLSDLNWMARSKSAPGS